MFSCCNDPSTSYLRTILFISTIQMCLYCKNVFKGPVHVQLWYIHLSSVDCKCAAVCLGSVEQTADPSQPASTCLKIYLTCTGLYNHAAFPLLLPQTVTTHITFPKYTPDETCRSVTTVKDGATSKIAAAFTNGQEQKGKHGRQDCYSDSLFFHISA